jgi:hypothetical protein
MTSPTQSNPLDLDAVRRIVHLLSGDSDRQQRLRGTLISMAADLAPRVVASTDVTSDRLTGLLLGAFRQAIGAQVSLTDPCADPPAPARVEALVVSPALRTWEVYGEGATTLDALVAACVAVLEREE